MGVVGWVVGPQDFSVFPWHFENGASIKIEDVLLKMVDYSMSFLSLSTKIFFDRQVEKTILDHSYFLNFCGTPPSCLKVRGGWWVVGGWWW